MWKVSVRLFLVMMLFAVSSVYAATCDSIWPAAYTGNSTNGPLLPTFTGSAPLILNNTLGNGDFHYAATSLSRNTLTTTGTTTRLYFNGDLQLSGSASLNPTGNPEDLIIIVNGDFQISGQAYINALVYVTGEATLTGSGSVQLNGAITAAGTVRIGGSAAITYDPDAASTADFGSLCSVAPPRLILVDPVCGASNQLIVNFDSSPGYATLGQSSAENIANYSVSDQNGTNLVVQSAVRSDEGYQVLLTLASSMVNGRNYNVSVSNVQDIAGEYMGVSTDTVYFSTQQQGVPASYWANDAFSGAYDYQQVDSNIDFYWGVFSWPSGSFLSGFSILWEGYLEPDVSGDFQFQMTSEDGSRVWLGDVASTMIIDGWSDGLNTWPSNTVSLVAGQRYPLKVEFYKRPVWFSTKTAQLQWLTPGGSSFNTVPNSNLYTCVDSFVSNNGLVAHYKLEGPTWNGTFGEVLDSSYNRLHGTGVGNPLSVPGQVCNGAQLDGSNLIRVNDNPLLDLTSELAITSWIRLDSYGPDSLNSIFSKDENYEFHINSSGQIFWWWQTSGSPRRTRSFDSGAATITLGNWHHVAIVYSQSRQSIYLDGVEVAYQTYSGEVLATNSDPLEIGADQGITGRRWRGMIDEVKLYDRALSGAEVVADMNATNPCASVLDHFEVSAAATASVCAPTPVTIRAALADNTTYTGYTGTIDIVTSSGHGNWSINSGTGLLNPASHSSDDGVVQYTFVAGDNGEVELNLSNTHADQLIVTATENGGTATGASSIITFSENALQINIAPGFDTDFVAGRPHALEVEMLRLDPDTGNCGRFEAYDGDIDLKAWMLRSANDAGGIAPELAGASGNTPLGNSAPAADNLTLGFSAGLATTELLTYDVGQYSLWLRDDTSGLVVDINSQPIALTGSSANYTVRPFGFDLQASSQRATPFNNPGATSAAGAGFVKAGETFDVNVRAVLHEAADDANNDGFPDAGADLSGNGATPAFGNEGESVILSATLLQPAPALLGVVDPGLDGGTTVTTFTNGVATASVRYDEVGIVQLDGQLQSGSYLGSSNVTGTISYVGRFYPDRFLVTDDGPSLRDGNDDSGNWTCDFTYQGQAFGFVSEPQITVTAVNLLGVTTRNYGDAFWSLPLPEHGIQLDPASPASGSVCLDGVGGIATDCFVENSASVIRSWLGTTDYDGIGIYSTGSHRFTINKTNDQPDAGDVPWDPLLDYRILAAELTHTETNGDELCYQVSGTCADYLIDDIGGTNLRYGRGWIDGGLGSVQTPLIMMLRLQYWDSAATFVNNPDDNNACLGTLVVDTDFQLSNFTDNLNAGETSVEAASNLAGYSLIRLGAPGYEASGNPNSGRTLLTWLLDTDTSDNDPGEACGEHWLCYDFDGDGLRENPSGQAVFGDLSDTKPVLFLKESYR